MKSLVSACLIGILFGLGITVSGMINPAKVLNFFDLAGNWDPSLAFVMGGGLVTALVGYRLVFVRLKAPLFGARFSPRAAGAIVAPVIYLAAGGAIPFEVPVSTAALVIGGLLVGIGVHFGNGCPSGHGICGLARLSPRSLAAVLTFMLAAFATVFVVRHVIGG